MTAPRSLLLFHPLPILPSREGKRLCPERPPAHRPVSPAPRCPRQPLPGDTERAAPRTIFPFPAEPLPLPEPGGWGHGRRRRCPPTPPPRDVNRGRFARPLPGQRSPPALTALRARPPPAPRRRGEAAAEEEENEEEEKAPEGLRGQCRLPPPPLPPSVPLSPPSRRAAPWDAPLPPPTWLWGDHGAAPQGARRGRWRRRVSSPRPPRGLCCSSLPPCFSPSPRQRRSWRDLANLLGERRSLTPYPRSVAPAGTVDLLF